LLSIYAFAKEIKVVTMDMMNKNGIVMFIVKIKRECLSKNDEATA